MEHKKALVLLFAVVIAAALIYQAYEERFDEGVLAATGFLLLALGYLTGLFAVLVGIGLSIFYFLTSLPIISVVYGWLIFTLSKIHYTIFNFIFKKTLGRMKWYRDLESWVLNSRTYKKLSSCGDRFLKRIGLANPLLVEVFPVKRCLNCTRKIPSDSKYCAYCGRNFAT